MTALIHACCSTWPHYGVIQKLLELARADVSVKTIVRDIVWIAIALYSFFIDEPDCLAYCCSEELLESQRPVSTTRDRSIDSERR